MRGRQALGLALLALAFAPLYRLMDTSVEAPHRQVTVEVADSTLELAWWGTVTTALLAWLLARFLPSDRLRRLVDGAVSRLMRPSRVAYSLVLACVSAGLAALIGLDLYEGHFTNVDEIASTLHARYLARGLIAGATLSMPEFWLIPNTLTVPKGWVSQFPPTHLVAMAAMNRLGIPMLLGPLSVAFLTGLVALSLPRLLPTRPRTARVSALAVAVCPLLLFIGGGSLSHVTAGAAGAAILYAALRARDGGAWWALPAGGAVGLMVSDRPLVGLVLGTLFTVGLWVPAALRSDDRRLGWLVARAGGTVVGGAPFAVWLAWYNHTLFGSAFQLGYLSAFGDRHRLGFHMDPWGYYYGPAEAAAFTSSDLLTAGVQLLETPFPVTAVIGLWLLTGTRVPRGAGLLLAWALLPVLANAFYWFHDVRMLFEATPAWVALGVLAATDLAGGDGTSVPGTAGKDLLGDRIRNVLMWAMAVGVVGAAIFNVPSRYRSYGWSQETLDRITAPSPPGTRASIVFVHASWNERLSATLQGAGGMRQDSVIPALRRNTNCALHRYTTAREARVRYGLDTTLPPVDLEQAPGTPVGIERPPSPSGATVRVRPGEPFPDACRRELNADRFGGVALAPLVWQGDLPGIERGQPLFVRDLGPEKNGRLLERYPERSAFVFAPTTVDGPPELIPYAEGMALLWGAS